jgi:hypothetical protein
MEFATVGNYYYRVGNSHYTRMGIGYILQPTNFIIFIIEIYLIFN